MSSTTTTSGSSPHVAENFDLVLSFHSNEIGLLTIDGFKKQIKDLIFFSRTYTTDLSSVSRSAAAAKRQLFEFNTYINNPIPVDCWGIETEWQTNFWYLPKPFDGLVLNVNYTHIFSDASYPRSEINTVYDDEGNMTQTIKDTSYTTRLLNQPNDIVNISFGYDYVGFSARLSMLYQDNIFKQPDFWMQNRVNSMLSHGGICRSSRSCRGSGCSSSFAQQCHRALWGPTSTRGPTSREQEHYGMSGDLGLRVKL